MNLKKAKKIRKQALEKTIAWYKTLLTDEESRELTADHVVQYVPYVKYYHTQNNPTTLMVSEFTRRWFILQEKKAYV